MIVAGIDIGSSTSKGVLLREKERISSVLLPTGPESEKMGIEVFTQLLNRIGLSREEVRYVVSTGYGRIRVPFSNEMMSEIACHAKGCHFIFPQVRTILDVGGQDCKAIRVNSKGLHTNFAMNDKCAAGTGRFLENMADLLKVELWEMGEIALGAKKEAKISSVCTVFAKSEVVSMLRYSIPREEILAGLHEAIASRIVHLLRQVKAEGDLVISGGGAKNRGLVKKVEEKVGMKALIPEEPQLTGALGAALFAWERFRRKGEAKERR
jgi:predicted CoA-substrate-specific enzyme activase